MRFVKCPASPNGLLDPTSFFYQTYCPTRKGSSKCKTCTEGQIVEIDCPMLKRCIGTDIMDCKNRDFFKCDYFQHIHGEEYMRKKLEVLFTHD